MRLLLAYADIRQHAPGRERASTRKGVVMRPTTGPSQAAMALSEVGEQNSVAHQQVQELRQRLRERRVQLCDIHLVRYSRQYGRKPVRLNVNKFKCCRTLQGHTGKIYALYWSYLESTRIVSASQDGRPIVWNAVSSQKTHAIRLACAWVMTAAFSPCWNCSGLWWIG